MNNEECRLLGCVALWQERIASIIRVKKNQRVSNNVSSSQQLSHAAVASYCLRYS
jgi:hypothetical protein